MIELDLRIEDTHWHDAVAKLEHVCLSALKAGAKVCGVSGQVSVLLTGNREIRTLNRDWRGFDKPTDVLAFGAGEANRPFLGDIVIGFGVAQRDAATDRIDFGQHMSHLLIHGLLHLVGYDHTENENAAEMERLEVDALASLGFPDPYR